MYQCSALLAPVFGVRTSLKTARCRRPEMNESKWVQVIAGGISEAFEETQRTKKPVVILVGDEYHGFNR